jgi:hypothetical protein
MKYLLMIYMNPTIFEGLSEDEQQAIMDAHEDFQKPIRASGELVGFAALADPSASATVRVREGVAAVTDGPYVEAKEIIVSFTLIQAADYDAAVAIARECPPGHTIEIREFAGYA